MSRLLFLSLMLLAPWGFPLCFFGVEQYLSMQLLLVGLAPATVYSVLRLMINQEKLSLPLKVALGLFLYCLLVSFISNSFFIPIPLSNWLPGTVYLTPILFVFVSSVFGFSPKHLLSAIVLSAFFCSVFVIIDQYAPMSAMDIYAHVTQDGGSVRRIVLFHNETAFASVICMARLLSPTASFKSRVFNIALSLPMIYSLAVISQSRLALAAALIGLSCYLAFVNKSRIRLAVIAAAALSAFAATPLAVNLYTERYGSTNLSDDNSYRVRRDEQDYFSGYFEETYGLGFGVMSQSINKPNLISNGLYYAAQSYGYPDAYFSLVDVRLLGALYQFGYLGFAIILAMSIYAAYICWQFSRTQASIGADEAGAFGCVIVGFLTSPLPANLFTADNTLMLGGFIWAVVGHLQRYMRPLRAAHYVPVQKVIF